MLQHVTDGGLETDLLFHRGIDLPEFAAYPLVDSAPDVLLAYYADYAAIAAAAGAGLILETPTWRANTDWGARLGWSPSELARVNKAAVDLVRQVRAPRVTISGVVGPRGDGYVASGTRADEAAEYHRPQVQAFAEAGVDVVHAMTLNEVAEAQGVVAAARAVGVPVGVSYTVETDGRLPDGTPLAEAVDGVDADWFGINCAHPTHVLPGLDGGAWQSRIQVFRPNASTMTHEELDAMEVLDEGDLPLLQASTRELLERLPSISTLGGCCGTDARHVAALWGVPARARP